MAGGRWATHALATLLKDIQESEWVEGYLDTRLMHDSLPGQDGR